MKTNHVELSGELWKHLATPLLNERQRRAQ